MCAPFELYDRRRNRQGSDDRIQEEYLAARYAPASVNSMLVSVNSFLRYTGQAHCCVKLLKIQRQIFCSEQRELTRQEYQRLVKAAGGTRSGPCAANDLRHGNPGERTAVYHGRGGVCVARPSLAARTRQLGHIHPLVPAESVKANASKTGLKTGPVFVSKTARRSTAAIYGGDESAVRVGRRFAGQGVSAQSAPPVRAHVLQH